MNDRPRALVLEGGGMRGTFTAGVLEAFAEKLGENGRGFDLAVACSVLARTLRNWSSFSRAP